MLLLLGKSILTPISFVHDKKTKPAEKHSKV